MKGVLQQWAERYRITGRMPRTYGRRLPSGFVVGQRVTMTHAARAVLGEPYSGWVVGGWRHSGYVRVVRDGQSSVGEYAVQFWRKMRRSSQLAGAPPQVRA